MAARVCVCKFARHVFGMCACACAETDLTCECTRSFILVHRRTQVLLERSAWHAQKVRQQGRGEVRRPVDKAGVRAKGRAGPTQELRVGRHHEALPDIQRLRPLQEEWSGLENLRPLLRLNNDG